MAAPDYIPFARALSLLATHMTAEGRAAAAEELRGLAAETEAERRLFARIADSLEEYSDRLDAEQRPK